MLQRSIFAAVVLATIIMVNLWHVFASWFVHTQGLLPGVLLLVIILLIAALVHPPWEDE